MFGFIPMNHPGIYRIWNTKTNRSYIGSSTTNCGTRIRNHFYRLRLRKHHSPLMQTDWLEHGDGSFMWEVLDRCEASACDAKEREFIDKFNSLDPMLGYNVNAASALPPSGKKRGRPKLGNVLFARRVSPELVVRLEGLVEEARAGKIAPSEETKAAWTRTLYQAGAEEVEGLRKQVKELTTQNYALAGTEERLTKEVADLTAKLDRCARATDDEKARRWMMMYDELKAKSAPTSDYDQTRS